MDADIGYEAPRFGLSESQWRGIREIRPPEQTRVDTVEAHRSTSIYLSDARFAAEMERVFKSVALPVMVSARLPEPNTSTAHDSFGIPMLFTRDKAGQVRGFINGCRHRGSKLIEGCEAVKGNRLSCPYHAWTYGLDGSLLAIARADVFPSLKTEDLPLIPLSTFESGGMIWVGLDPNTKPDILEGAQDLCMDLDAKGFRRNHIYGHRTFDLNANWKIVAEAFQEGYHAPRLHAKSVGSNFNDIASVLHHFGPHSRQMSGRVGFDARILDESVNIHRHVTMSYYIFPNVCIVTSPYYTSYLFFAPRDKGRTIAEYYMMVDGPPDSPKGEEIYSRSYELALEVFADEDFHNAEGTWQAIGSGAIPTVYYGGLELLIPPFHETIEARIAGAA